MTITENVYAAKTFKGYMHALLIKTPEPPQLAPFNVKEQRHYLDFPCMSELLTLSLRLSHSQPFRGNIFQPPVCHVLAHYKRLATIGEVGTVNSPQQMHAVDAPPICL